MIYSTFDNRRKITDIGSLSRIANTPISLLQESKELIVVTGNLNGIKDNYVFSYSEHDKSLSTGNVMGFIGFGDDELKIRSRFDEGQGDYLLHYMLMRVCCPNIVNLNHSTNNDSAFDLLMFLFPKMLSEAMKQGLFKEYKRFQHNDSKVRGTIDVNRHIRNNIPFAGAVAYNTREFSYDNNITQLIRHTIEYIKAKPLGYGILEHVTAEIRMIMDNTPTYTIQNRRKVINENQRPLHHPYFTKYTMLQKLCLQILRYDGLKYGMDKNKVHGILFDGAWLWEEYVAAVIMDKYDHYTKDNSHFYLFKNNVQRIIPDYISKDETIVADAKYIPLDENGLSQNEERACAIYYKTVMYMMRWNCHCGLLFYPSKESSSPEVLIINNCNNDCVKKVPLLIPQLSNSLPEFISAIKYNEENQFKFLIPSI